MSYYRTPSGVEVDFIWTGPKHSVGIEVKASPTWRRSYVAPLLELQERKVIRRAVGVYEGEHAQRHGALEVLPLREFLERLPELVR